MLETFHRNAPTNQEVLDIHTVQKKLFARHWLEMSREVLFRLLHGRDFSIN